MGVVNSSEWAVNGKIITIRPPLPKQIIESDSSSKPPPKLLDITRHNRALECGTIKSASA